MAGYAVFTIFESNRNLYKDAILAYLSGEKNINETKLALHTASTYQTTTIHAKVFAKHIPLYTEPTDRELDPKIIKILQHLQQPTGKAYYTDKGIHSLYDVLRKIKDKDIEYLIELIDNHEPITPWFYYIFKPAVVLISVCTFSYLQPQYFWLTIDWIQDFLPVIYHWLYHYAVQLNNWPIIGMTTQIGWLYYYLRYTFQHGLDPTIEKIRTLLFRTLALSLTFLGHLFAFWAAGTLSWAPAAFFIGSSIVGIIESIYFYTTQRKPVSLEEDSDVHTIAWQARHNFKIERNHYYFLVRLIHAIAISGLLVACTLLPPSLFLTMTYTISLSLAFLVRDYCIELIKHRSAAAEQIAVAAIYSSPDLNPERRREEDISAFQKYVAEFLGQYQDERDESEKNKRETLQATALTLMQKPNFTLESAKEIFKNCAEVANKVSPSPQQPSHLLSQSRYSFTGRSPARRNLSAADYTPVHGTSLFS